MSHLSLETIARIVDDGPTADENAHLDGCASCRAELDAMREDVQALAMLPDIAPTTDAWDALEARLAGEGLLQRTPQRSHGRVPLVRFAQMAAAITLFVAGTFAGRMSAESVPSSLARVTGDTNAPAQIAADPRGGPTNGAANGASTTSLPYATSAPDGAAAQQPLDMQREAPRPNARNANVTLASNTGSSAFPQPRTLEEAALLLRQTEELYVTALTRYAELSTQAEPGDPVARLAALQSIVLTTQAALNQTPADPVINGYHLTALAQRDAALRQVAASSGERWY